MKNERLQKFRNLMKQNDIECALIYSDSNRNYLTGFTGDESYIVITQSDAIFVTDSRYTEQAIKQTSGFEVRQYENSIINYLQDIIKSLNVKSVGIEENYMSVDVFENLKDGLSKVEFVKLNHLVEKIRQIKDDSEIEKIAAAASIADKAFTHMLEYIKPGMTEIEVAVELEFYMRRLGASGTSFTSIVASGKRSSLPHGTATNKVIEAGDFLTLDYGCVYENYCSDMTRTIVVGKACDKQREIYNIVLEANEAALRAVKPGITGEELDRIARKIITDKGYGQYFGHGLGHGVGMQIHELPNINKRGKTPLEAGMIITDEPGIYIPDFGGVRIEDLIVVTDSGYKVLSNSSKKLIELE